MAQVAELLSDGPAIEYLDGRRYRKVSPRTTHARVQGLLVAILERCGRGFGMAGTEWDFRVGAVDRTESLFVPDVAFVTFEQLRLVDAKHREELPIAPLIAAEVRSPANLAALRRLKVARYLSCGSLLVLDVDPQRCRIVAHTQTGSRSYASLDRFEHEAISWLSFDVAEAFAGLEHLR